MPEKEQEIEYIHDTQDDIEIDDGLKEQWSLMGVWNDELLLAREQRELKRRKHIWASEIGRDPFERWLKMYGVPEDIPFPNRVLRVFEAGNFFERMIGLTFKMAGLVKEDNQRYFIDEDEHHLGVSVKPDFIVGGTPDWEKVLYDIENDPMYQFMFWQMPSLKTIALKLIDTYKEKYPNGLENMLYEIKTVNSQVFWAKKDYLSDAYEHHKMQTFTGMKATGVKQGRRLYISKDDLTLAEFPLQLDDPTLNEKWENDVQQMTEYIRRSDDYFMRKGLTDEEIVDAIKAGEVPPDVMPPKPNDVVFDERKKMNFQLNKVKYTVKGVFTDNWEVAWSNYFPTITGMDSVDEWKMKNKSIIKERNDKLKEQYKQKHNLVKI